MLRPALCFIRGLKSISVDQVAAATKPGIQSARFHGAAEKEAGREEQHERERNLGHDRDVTRGKETTESPDPRRFADLLLEVVNQVGAGGFQGRAETEEQRGQHARRNVTTSTVRRDED